jgi:outer membrane protein assembly factor BamD
MGLRASIGRGAAVRRGSNYADDGAVTRIGEIRERNARADLLARGCADLRSAGFAANGLQQPVQQRRRLRSLYNQGLFLLNTKQDYKAAAKKFDEVDRENPYSEWARKALLMSAYAYYQADMYDDCVNSAKRYVALHPGSPDAAYAQYLIGSSYYDQILDVSRDQARAEKAIDALQQVVRKYPSSEYAISAQKKIGMAHDQMAGKEMDVGRFYLNKRDFVGAINRFKVVVTQYQTTRHVEEALMRLSECYVALGIIDEAQTAAAVLGHNFPDSAWYKDAYRLVKTAGGEPTTENKGSWISRAFQKMGLTTSQNG